MEKMTLADIARKAGVSRCAVSFYLNGKAAEHRLSDKVVQRIHDVIKENRYIPNFHARAIGLKKTFLVGVIATCPTFESFWSEILAGVERELKPHDYHMLLGVSGDMIEKETELFDFMLSKGVDGIIYSPAIAPDGSASPNPLRIAESIPVVSILTPVKGLPSVYTDNEEGGSLAARHLVEMGHRGIAYLGPLSETGSHPLNGRFNGARQFLAGKGLELTAIRDIPSFLNRLDEFTAVFCFSDFIAGDLYKACLIRGVKIPGTLSVMGFDNMGFTRFLHPELTTVNQGKEELGEEAAKLILGKIGVSQYEGHGQTVKLKPTLKRGASICKL